MEIARIVLRPFDAPRSSSWWCARDCFTSGHPLIRKRDLVLLNGETFVCVCVGDDFGEVAPREKFVSFCLYFSRIGFLFKMPLRRGAKGEREAE